MKSTAVFLLTCLSAAVLLAGCGGGGGGGGGTSPGGNTGNLPRSLSPLTKDAPSNLPAMVTGATGSHATFLSTPQSDGSGGSVTVTQLNPDAMLAHYSSGYGANAKVTTANREFLAIPTHIDAGLLGWDDYAVLRNSADGVAPPAIAVYSVTTSGGRMDARVRAAVTLMLPRRVNQIITLATGVSQITAAVHNAGLRLGDNNVVFIRNGYSANVHSPLGSGDLEEGYRLFVKGEYASFYLRIDETASHREPWGDSYSGGIFTDYSTLRNLSPVTYNIRHAMGTYNERNAANNRLLSGNGFLRAGFNSRRVTLSLGIFDHNGEKFMDVNNLGMSIHARRNQFLCSGAGDSSSCTGSIDYAVDASVALSDITDFRNYNEDNGFHNAVGSFYGSNYEEVAGGFIHRMTGRSDGNNAWLNLGFIGRKVGAGEATLPRPIRSFPVVGALSPLPSSAYVSVSGNTQIRRNALIDFYTNRNLEVTDANREFLAGGSGDMGEDDGNYNTYTILRNSDDYLEAPSFVAYTIQAGRATATVRMVATLGALLSVSKELTLLTGYRNNRSKTITVGFSNNELRFGANTLTVDGGYGVRAFDADPNNTYGTISYFIDGQYAGLHLGFYPSFSPRSPAAIHTWGGRTSYGGVPASGNLYYNLHAMGSYEYNANQTYDNRILSGSGALHANLGSNRRAVNLSLHVLDDTGDEFVSIKDLQMTLDSSRNGFRCTSHDCAGYMRFGNNTRLSSYANFREITVRGGFYGPNAEEVAGRVFHSPFSYLRWDLGFIGRQGQQPPQVVRNPVPIVASPAPVATPLVPPATVGALSPLPSSAYITVNGTAQIRRDALIRFYTNRSSGDRAIERYREFFMDGSGITGEDDDNYNTYRVIRNSVLPRATPPSIITYRITRNSAVGATIASVVDRSDHILQRTRMVLSLNTPRKTVTIGRQSFYQSVHLRLGSNTLTIGNGYFAHVFDSDISSTIATYSYLIQGQHAGLYSDIDFWSSRIDNVYAWGTRTGYSDIPTSGDLSYPLHVMGYYKYSNDSTDSRRILSGSGVLHANLGSSRAMNLSLHAVDDQGRDFVSISDLQVSLASNRNEFSCAEDECLGYIRYGESVDDIFNNFGRITVRGSFYGPRAEEVAGRMFYYRNNSRGWGLGFIGKREGYERIHLPVSPFPLLPAEMNTPAPSVGGISPLPKDSYVVARSQSGTDFKVPADFAVPDLDGAVQINSDALFDYYYYNRYGSSVKVTTANREFLLNGHVYHDGRLRNYLIMRNPASGSHAPPSLIGYAVQTGGTDARAQAVVSPGRQFALGRQYGITLGSDTISLSVPSNGRELRVGDSAFISLRNGYSARAHGTSTQNPDNYSFFLQSEYAVLYMEAHTSPTVTTDSSGTSYNLLGGVWSGGALMHDELVPIRGRVTHNIGHVIGAYTDHQNHANSRLLSGGGTLVADFSSSSRMVTLNLFVTDHRGQRFMDVTNLGMSIDADSNEFHCAGPVCRGTIDYANPSRGSDIRSWGSINNGTFSARGSFYGPFGEEVAGGIYHNGGSNFDTDIGFIGRDIDYPFPPPPPPVAPNPISPVLSIGAVSPLPANAYIAAGGGTIRINTYELFNYYSSIYDADDKVADANLEFLAIPSLDFAGILGRNDRDFYIVLRNSADGSTPPAIAGYEVRSGEATAYIVGAATLGAQIDGTNRQAFTLNWGNSSNTLQGTVISSSELRLGASTLTLNTGYSLRAYSPNPNSNPALEVEDYSFFIDAEYSALYLGLDSSPSVDPSDNSPPEQDHIGNVYSGGVLTPYSNLPTVGNLTYQIDHAVGAYTDGKNLSNNRVLSGNGNLMANFSSQAVNLSLSVFDHNGSLFMHVNNLSMSVDPGRNQFHCSTNGSSRCGGSINYADDVRFNDITDFSSDFTNVEHNGSRIPSGHFFNANGSFYGPNAEEVAGGMSHTDLAADGPRMDLGFIGKRDTSIPSTRTSPVTAPQPPVIIVNPNPPGGGGVTRGSGTPATE